MATHLRTKIFFDKNIHEYTDSNINCVKRTKNFVFIAEKKTQKSTRLHTIS